MAGTSGSHVSGSAWGPLACAGKWDSTACSREGSSPRQGPVSEMLVPGVLLNCFRSVQLLSGTRRAGAALVCRGEGSQGLASVPFPLTLPRGA